MSDAVPSSARRVAAAALAAGVAAGALALFARWVESPESDWSLLASWLGSSMAVGCIAVALTAVGILVRLGEDANAPRWNRSLPTLLGRLVAAVVMMGGIALCARLLTDQPTGLGWYAWLLAPACFAAAFLVFRQFPLSRITR